MSERVVETMRIRAGTTFHSNNITEVQAALKTAWKELRENKKTAQVKQELHLQEMLKESQKASEDKWSKAIM